MVITGLFVAIDIYGYLNSSANHLWMLLNIVTVFYLNQRDVREVVGAAVPDIAHRPRRPRDRDARADTRDPGPRDGPGGGDARTERRRGAAPALRAHPALHARRAVPPDARDALRGSLRPADRRDALHGTGADPLRHLDEATLATAGEDPPGEVRFLRFVQEPLNPIELARFNSRPDRPRFKAPGQLARVGLLARMLDAGLVASPLLVRGKVPGGTAAAAAIKYEAIRAAETADQLSRPGRPPGRLGGAPVPVLLPDERLALDLRRRQRPRGGLGAGVHHPGGAAGRRRGAGVVRRGRARRAGRGPAAQVGRPEAPHRGRACRGLPGRRVARHVHGAGRVHHAARAAGCRPAARNPRLGPPTLARHPQPARSGRPCGIHRPPGQRPR